MELIQIPDGAAVGYHISVKPKFVPEHALDQLVAGGSRLPIHAVIRTHDRSRMSLVNAVTERRQIGIPKILFADLGVKAVADALRAAVSHKVLQGGVGLMINRVVSLQALYIGGAHPSGEVRILAVGLMAPSPAGISENIDVGRPAGQTLIDLGLAVLSIIVVFCPGFVRHRFADLPEQFIVKAWR